LRLLLSPLRAYCSSSSADPPNGLELSRSAARASLLHSRATP